ncbi:MAG: glycosyltransferase family 4 protein, partial [Tepidisphaeraceae bacterium]
NDETYPVGDLVEIAPSQRHNLSKMQRLRCMVGRRVGRWDWAYYGVFKSRFMSALRKMAQKPDVVIVHNDLVSSRHLKRAFPQVKVVVWLHNEQRTQQRRMDSTLRHTDAFVCVSDYIRDWTLRQYGIPADRIHTILNAVDAETFTPRSDLRLANCAVRVLFIGRIDPNKGPDLAVDAVKGVREFGAGIRITVAGSLWWYGLGSEMSDPYFRLLRAKMDQANAEYVGHVTRPNVPALIREHDIVCVLSRSNEPFGLVVLEAMASGCAVIASNRGGLPQACGDAAILVDPDDLSSIVAQLHQLATNPQMLMDRKRRSLEHASRHTWRHRVGQMESLFRTWDSAS